MFIGSVLENYLVTLATAFIVNYFKEGHVRLTS